MPRCLQQGFFNLWENVASVAELFAGPRRSRINEDKVFFPNNQPHALIIQILFCSKTLHVSGTFSAHRQEFSIVHSTLVIFMQVSDDRFQA